jgi:diguanylate cyclase (GGDEF)-like protein
MRTTDSMLAQVLERGFAWLRFPEPLEHEFRDDRILSMARWVRLFLIVAIFTSLGFSAIDHWVIRAHNALPDMVRYGLQLPVLLICLTATLRPSFMRWYPVAILMGGPLYGLGSVLLVCFAEPDHIALVGSRLLLVTFFIFFMSGQLLKPALISNLIVLALFVAAGISGMVPGEVATYLTFALIVANVIGSVGLYSLEHANRTSFIEKKLLRESANQDGLTGLLNRQSYDDQARGMLRRAAARGRQIAVLMVDVDNFKQYNDEYGHQAGDVCLKQVATAVQRAITERGGGCVARYGGEEFIVMLDSDQGVDAQVAAEGIVSEVAALAIPQQGLVNSGRVSVSVGAAIVSAASVSSLDDVTRIADSALYSAKRQGRNRSVISDMLAAEG